MPSSVLPGRSSSTGKRTSCSRAGKLTEDEAFECTYEIAARCCPSLAERIDTLTLQQVTALVALAGSHVKEVEEHPKYSRPLTPLNSRENGMEGAISD